MPTLMYTVLLKNDMHITEKLDNLGVILDNDTAYPAFFVNPKDNKQVSGTAITRNDLTIFRYN